MIKHRRRKRNPKLFFLSLAIGAGVFFLAIAAWLAFLLVEIPSIENLKERKIAESTKIYDYTGETLLWEVHGDERRTVVPLDRISRHIQNATIAIEDSSFYTHGGVRIPSIIRAAIADIFQGKKQGGSTITQQLIKNTLLNPDRTLTRKVKEMVMSVKMESNYSKDEILSLYLNEIPYGSNTYGIESASQAYFGKSAEEVSLAEAAYLAALPKAPTRYSPYGNNRELLETRKNLVLERMKELLFITDEEYERARNETVSFLPQRKQGLIAPHFVIYVREQLIERYGEDVVERGGLEVITTLDLDLQQKGEEILTRRVAENEQKYNASNAGLVALDPKTGRILVMVGSRDYFDIEHEGNFNVTLARRQPGSAFKPIVYAAAFKRGYTPDTVVFDLETNFSTNRSEPYIPKNFDGKHRGPLTLRSALAQSLNVPSVKVLYLAGIQNAIDMAEDFGISTLTDRSRFGLSLVLGGGEVTPLELSGAFGVFANQGIKTDTHAIIRVQDRNGNTLEEERVSSERVIDANIANMINDILSDNEARTPMFGPRSSLYFEGYDVAAKTGTTNDYHDAWTVGYTPNIVVGAWAGNNNNTPMKENIAGITISPLWREFMLHALGKLGKESFTEPQLPSPQKPVLRGVWQGSRSYFIDTNSGKLATEYTPGKYRQERVMREIHSILYWVSKEDPDGKIPEHPESDPQFELWEEPVRRWALKQNIIDENSTIPIVEHDTSHSPENWPTIEWSAAERDTVFKQGDAIVFHPRITGKNLITAVEIFVDSEFIKSEIGSVNTIALGTINPGRHTLTLKVYDSIGNKQEAELLFTAAGL